MTYISYSTTGIQATVLNFIEVHNNLYHILNNALLLKNHHNTLIEQTTHNAPKGYITHQSTGAHYSQRVTLTALMTSRMLYGWLLLGGMMQLSAGIVRSLYMEEDNFIDQKYSVHTTHNGSAVYLMGGFCLLFSGRKSMNSLSLWAQITIQYITVTI